MKDSPIMRVNLRGLFIWLFFLSIGGPLVHVTNIFFCLLGMQGGAHFEINSVIIHVYIHKQCAREKR